jgi:hypothetical protein
MADRYVYCEDHGHVLNEYATDADGFQQCECCGCYFDPEEIA